MEAPICCEVLVMADVTPTSFGSAFWVAVLMQGTMARPSPKPSSSSLGSTLVQYEASGVSCVKSETPSAASRSPGTTSSRVRTCGMRRLATCVAASASMAISGRKAMPVLRGSSGRSSAAGR